MNFALAFASLMLLAAPALAQTPPGPEEEIKVTGKRICRMETSIGSMMPRRVCRTKEQSKEEERARQTALERLDYLRDQQNLMIKRMMENY